MAALYQDGGQYEYMNNFNPAGIISLVLSTIIGMLCSMDYALYVGMAVSMVMYWALMKYWVIKKYPQKELSPDYLPDYAYAGEGLENGREV